MCSDALLRSGCVSPAYGTASYRLICMAIILYHHIQKSVFWCCCDRMLCICSLLHDVLEIHQPVSKFSCAGGRWDASSCLQGAGRASPRLNILFFEACLLHLFMSYSVNIKRKVAARLLSVTVLCKWRALGRITFMPPYRNWLKMTSWKIFHSAVQAGFDPAQEYCKNKCLYQIQILTHRSIWNEQLAYLTMPTSHCPIKDTHSMYKSLFLNLLLRCFALNLGFIILTNDFCTVCSVQLPVLWLL